MAEKFQGVPNFRDLGGIKTADQRIVKANLLLRSGELSAVTKQDEEILQNQYHLKTVIDYRDIEEAAATPSVELAGVNMYIEPASTAEENTASVKQLIDDGVINQLEKKHFIQLYENLPINSKAYKLLVEKFKETSEATAILQHCTAGKDRTGVGVMILYLILDVPLEAIIEEYLLTNDYMKEHTPAWVETMRPYVKDEATLDLLISVNRDFLTASYNTILAHYETVENYIEKEFGIDQQERQRLQNFYLM